MGLIGLLAAICQRSRAATIAALLVVLISTAVAWPVYEYGEQAYDRVLSMADSDGQAWLATHRERAEHLIWCFYAVAVLSAIALIVPVKWPRSSLWLAAAVLVLGAITLGVGGYIAYAGGKIRHREFRNEPPQKTCLHSPRKWPNRRAPAESRAPPRSVAPTIFAFTSPSCSAARCRPTSRIPASSSAGAPCARTPTTPDRAAPHKPWGKFARIARSVRRVHVAFGTPAGFQSVGRDRRVPD